MSFALPAAQPILRSLWWYIQRLNEFKSLDSFCYRCYQFVGLVIEHGLYSKTSHGVFWTSYRTRWVIKNWSWFFWTSYRTRCVIKNWSWFFWASYRIRWVIKNWSWFFWTSCWMNKVCIRKLVQRTQLFRWSGADGNWNAWGAPSCCLEATQSCKIHCNNLCAIWTP